MRPFITCFLFLFVVFEGCTFHFSEKNIPANTDYYGFVQEKAKGRLLTAKLNDGTTISNKVFEFNKASFSWEDNLGLLHSSAIQNVKSFSYNSSASGALLYGTSGIFAGGITGAVISGFMPEPSMGGPAYGPVEYAAFGALAGGVLGTIIGLIEGKEITYYFNGNDGSFYYRGNSGPGLTLNYNPGFNLKNNRNYPGLLYNSLVPLKNNFSRHAISFSLNL